MALGARDGTADFAFDCARLSLCAGLAGWLLKFSNQTKGPQKPFWTTNRDAVF